MHNTLNFAHVDSLLYYCCTHISTNISIHTYYPSIRVCYTSIHSTAWWRSFSPCAWHSHWRCTHSASCAPSSSSIGSNRKKWHSGRDSGVLDGWCASFPFVTSIASPTSIPTPLNQLCGYAIIPACWMSLFCWQPISSCGARRSGPLRLSM